MINQLFNSISSSIYNFFGDVTIYFNHIPQHFSTPSFFIRLLSINEKRLISSRAKLLVQIQITYFQQSQDNLNINKNSIIKNLIYSLELVQCSGKLLRYKNLELKEDENLTIILDYEISISKNNEISDKMQNLIQ